MLRRGEVGALEIGLAIRRYLCIVEVWPWCRCTCGDVLMNDLRRGNGTLEQWVRRILIGTHGFTVYSTIHDTSTLVMCPWSQVTRDVHEAAKTNGSISCWTREPSHYRRYFISANLRWLLKVGLELSSGTCNSRALCINPQMPLVRIHVVKTVLLQKMCSCTGFLGKPLTCTVFPEKTCARTHFF